MRKSFILLGMLLSLTVYGQTPVFNLIPMPSEIKIADGKFRLLNTFRIGISGNPNERIYGYASRVLRRLDGRTGLFLSQEYISKNDTESNPGLSIEISRPGNIKLNEDESYSLEIDSMKALLRAATDIGAMRGLETFLQLLYSDENGYYFPCVKINDVPRFAWRGLMLDVCRHFLPMDVVLRNIDGMAAVKMNVLHLHLTEDQGFRIECKTYPLLHEKGSDGLYFTQLQMRDIIKYAADRGIRVVPEFDIPGHATSWCVGYPELASAPGPYTIERHFGVFNPTMDPTKENTYTFLDGFLKEMATLFPDEYIHIGGDENNGRQWTSSKEIQDFMKAKNLTTNHELQAYFNRHILDILTKYNKKMIGWDEILQTTLPKNIVIHSWRGREGMMTAAKNGFQSILSNGYYIDLIQPTDFHYLNDPLPDNIDLSAEEKKFILGGEATMWSEMVTAETVDSRIWPRTAAIAERLWSPSRVKDVNSMYQRLDIMSLQLEEFGLTHEKNRDMLLRRLTSGQDIQALKTLVDVCEPVKEYRRSNNRQVIYTSYSPYTRFVDAARPDAKTAREFNNMVAEYLQTNDKLLADKLSENLKIWTENDTKLSSLFKQSPILKEVETLSSDLKTVATIGQEALQFILKKNKPKTEWAGNKLDVLKNAKKSRGQAELMVLSGIEKLVNRASAL